MRCVHCGMNIPDDAQICPYCHSDTGESVFASFSGKKQIGQILLILGGLATLFWFVMNDGSWSWSTLIPIAALIIGLCFLHSAQDSEFDFLYFWMGCKWGGYILGVIFILFWMIGLECDFEWEFFQIGFYGLCLIVLGLISGFIVKKLEK